MRLLFETARLAYEPEDKGLPGFRDLGLDPEFIDRQPTQAYAANAGRDVIIAFRGTELSFGDILTDLKIIRRHTPHGALHSGFWAGYGRIHTAVADCATNAARRCGRVWLAGHSLGGATALVAALHRLSVGDKLMALYTFAQLRVGDDTFGDFADEQLAGRYFRIYHAYDMTPQVPPSRAAAREFGNLITARLPIGWPTRTISRLAALSRLASRWS